MRPDHTGYEPGNHIILYLYFFFISFYLLNFITKLPRYQDIKDLNFLVTYKNLMNLASY